MRNVRHLLRIEDRSVLDLGADVLSFRPTPSQYILTAHLESASFLSGQLCQNVRTLLKCLKRLSHPGNLFGLHPTRVSCSCQSVVQGNVP